ncbi:MAG: hypothetical protein KAR83_02390 [Thermodesulfovibrionales bacterium]|nr:hypothetical protein [Thermodesulfovibrionales bacterium]
MTDSPEIYPEICVVCAWRATCQKKFSISGRDMRCPDFSRDVTLKNPSTQDDEPAINNSNKE